MYPALDSKESTNRFIFIVLCVFDGSPPRATIYHTPNYTEDTRNLHSRCFMVLLIHLFFIGASSTEYFSIYVKYFEEAKFHCDQCPQRIVKLSKANAKNLNLHAGQPACPQQRYLVCPCYHRLDPKLSLRCCHSVDSILVHPPRKLQSPLLIFIEILPFAV